MHSLGSVSRRREANHPSTPKLLVHSPSGESPSPPAPAPGQQGTGFDGTRTRASGTGTPPPSGRELVWVPLWWCIPVQTAIEADGPTQHKVARLHSVPPLTARVFFVPQEAAGRSTETSMPTGSTRPRCTLTVDTFYRGYRRQAQETTQLGRQKGLGGGQPLLATGPCSWGRAACVHVRRKHERPVKT